MCIIIIKIDCLRALFTQKARECLGSLSLIKNCVFKLCVQIKICEKRQTRNVQFRFMPNAFRILKPFRKFRNAFECFVTQVQTHLPKTKPLVKSI